jgi:hypothetical protein
VLSAQDVFYRALPCLILNQYNNKIPKAINTITNYRKPISTSCTRTKTHHKHRGICCLLSLVKTCLIHYSIILNLTTVNVPRIENIIFFNLQKKTVAFLCVWYLVVPQTGNQSCVHIQSCRSFYATLHLCQRPFYKIFVKFRNSKKIVFKIVLIIVNINKDENKSLISNQFPLKNDLWSFL